MAVKRIKRPPVVALDDGRLAVEISTVPPSPLEVQRCLHAALIATVPRRRATQATAEAVASRYTVALERVDGVWHLVVARALLVEAL